MAAYITANDFFKKKFGCKIIKIPINGGFTCPNRDGSKGVGGCIFCSEKGSGDFLCPPETPIPEQFNRMREIMHKKWKTGKYMIYFQSFTNTYAPIEKLREMFTQAANLENVVGISIATRPDLVTGKMLPLLS